MPTRDVAVSVSSAGATRGGAQVGGSMNQDEQVKRWRVRLVHQRRALRQLNRALADKDKYLRLAWSEGNAIRKELQALRLAYDKFRGNYFWRVFGWRVHLWRNDTVLTWPIYEHKRSRRFTTMSETLHTHAYHHGGCGKFDADNKFDERRACTCGLAYAFDKDGWCECVTCRTHRGERHLQSQRPPKIGAA